MIVVAILGAVVAALAFLRSGGVYEELGKGDLALDEPGVKGPEPGSAAWRAEADEELRQLLEAKAARAEARGEQPIDVERELARLSGQAATATDPALRAEVRDMVIGSNERRARRGQPLLDVDEEIERRLRDAGGL